MAVINISDPTALFVVGNISDDVGTRELNGAWDIIIHGNHAIVSADVDDGLEFLDITGEGVCDK